MQVKCYVGTGAEQHVVGAIRKMRAGGCWRKQCLWQ